MMVAHERELGSVAASSIVNEDQTIQDSGLNLCDDCSVINLNGFLGHAEYLYSLGRLQPMLFAEHSFDDVYDSPIIPLGIRLGDTERTTCLMCQFLREARLDPLTPLHLEYEIRAYPASSAPWHMRGRKIDDTLNGSKVECGTTGAQYFRPSNKVDMPQGVLLAVLPALGRLDCDKYAETYRNVASTWFGRLDGSDRTAGECCMIKPLLDTERIRQWLNICMLEHKHLEKSVVSSVQDGTFTLLKLIDAQCMKIVPASRIAAYAALSYTWGSNHPSNMDIPNKADVPTNANRNFEAVYRLPRSLPRVVEDAIRLIKALGIRYLWIDRYCIDQSNIPELHEHLRRMDDIYKTAIVTIIAAAGDGVAEAGLPGVGSTLRNKQTLINVGGWNYGIFRHPKDIIHQSVWASRGWTYQEAVNSTRRLIITDDQAYFECTNMHAFEAINSTVQAAPVKPRVNPTIAPPANSLMGPTLDPREVYKRQRWLPPQSRDQDQAASLIELQAQMRARLQAQIQTQAQARAHQAALEVAWQVQAAQAFTVSSFDGGPPRLGWTISGTRRRDLVYGALLGHIRNYTARTLSFPEDDSLNGLLGILNSYRTAVPPVFHLWGLPVRPAAYPFELIPLSWSLTWYHIPFSNVALPGSRRKQFPSWSWCGWSNRVAWLEQAFDMDSSPEVGFGNDIVEAQLSIKTQHGSHVVSHHLTNDSRYDAFHFSVCPSPHCRYTLNTLIQLSLWSTLTHQYLGYGRLPFRLQ